MTPVELLVARGADRIPDLGGSLLDHLHRVAHRLSSYGASPALVAAGLTHAVYGTEGFEGALLAVDERELLREAVGAEAEEIVYRYAATVRGPFYRQLGQPLVVWTDRFTGASVTLDPPDVAPLVEITVANEVDTVLSSGEAPDPGMRAVLARARGVMSDAAWADVVAVLGN